MHQGHAHGAQPNLHGGPVILDALYAELELILEPGACVGKRLKRMGEARGPRNGM